MDGSDQARPIAGGVSAGGEVLRGVASEDRATVLIERRVAHVRPAVFEGSPVFENPVFENPVFENPVFENPVFENPVIPDEGPQRVRVGASA